MRGDAEWLASLLSACDRGLARLGAVEAPPLALLRDLQELRGDLLAQIAALDGPPKNSSRC